MFAQSSSIPFRLGFSAAVWAERKHSDCLALRNTNIRILLIKKIHTRPQSLRLLLLMYIQSAIFQFSLRFPIHQAQMETNCNPFNKTIIHMLQVRFDDYRRKKSAARLPSVKWLWMAFLLLWQSSFEFCWMEQCLMNLTQTEIWTDCNSHIMYLSSWPRHWSKQLWLWLNSHWALHLCRDGNLGQVTWIWMMKMHGFSGPMFTRVAHVNDLGILEIQVSDSEMSQQSWELKSVGVLDYHSLATG